MVNNTIVSQFTGPVPLSEEASREIKGGPLYPAKEVLDLLASTGNKAIIAWTNKCVRDMQKWELDDEDLHDLIGLALRNGRYRGAEWCVQAPHGPWAACDGYTVMRNEWIPHAHREMDIEYYVKFAIAKTGNVLLVVSCHPSEDRS